MKKRFMSNIVETIKDRLKLYENLTERLSVTMDLTYYEIVKPKDIDSHITEIKQLIDGEKDTWVLHKDYEGLVKSPGTPMRKEYVVELVIVNGKITPSVNIIRDSFNVKTRHQKRLKGKFVKGGVTIEDFPLYQVTIQPCVFNSPELYDYQRFVDQFNTNYTTVKSSKELLLRIVSTLQRQSSCQSRLKEFYQSESGFRKSVKQTITNVIGVDKQVLVDAFHGYETKVVYEV